MGTPRPGFVRKPGRPRGPNPIGSVEQAREYLAKNRPPPVLEAMEADARAFCRRYFDPVGRLLTSDELEKFLLASRQYEEAGWKLLHAVRGPFPDGDEEDAQDTHIWDLTAPEVFPPMAERTTPHSVPTLQEAIHRVTQWRQLFGIDRRDRDAWLAHYGTHTAFAGWMLNRKDTRIRLLKSYLKPPSPQELIALEVMVGLEPPSEDLRERDRRRNLMRQSIKMAREVLSRSEPERNLPPGRYPVDW